MGNGGIHEVSGSQEGTPSRQWVTYDLKKALINAADQAMEDLLAFLEENAADYPTWQASPAYTAQAGLFVQNIGQLVANVGNLQQSRRVFLALRSYLNKAEEFYIKPLLGAPFFAEIKSKLQKRTALTEPEKQVVDLCRAPIAHLALARALPELSLHISEEGITYKSSTNGVIKEEKPDVAYVDSHIRSLKADGDALLGVLQAYLLDNADTFPFFQESNTFKNANTNDEDYNDPDSAFVFV